MTRPNLPAALDQPANVLTFEKDMVPAHLFKTGFSRALYTGAVDSVVKEMYSIAVVDITKGTEIPVVDGLDPHGNGNGGRIENNKLEFYFTVPPRNISTDEPFATKIIPTQNGGRYIESQGSLIRELKISGTTGIRPNPSLPRSVDILSEAGLGVLTAPIASVVGPLIDLFGQGDKDTRRISPKERTGYEDVMRLRNIFRHYSDIKKSRSEASKYVMLWRNVKDADYWVVEPMSFQLVQDSKSPLTYEYVITFKTISKFVHNYTPSSRDPLTAMKAASAWVAQVQQSSRECTNTLLVVSASIHRLAGLGVFAENQLMNPLIRTINGVQSIVESVRSVPASAVANWRRLNEDLKASIATLEKSFGFDLDTLSSFADTIDMTAEQTETRDGIMPVLNSLRAAQRATRQVLINPKTQSTIQEVSSGKKAALEAAYSKATIGSSSLVAPNTKGSSAFLGNQQMAGNFASAQIGPRDTLQSLAQQYIGNRNRWQQLAIINDLKSPYISSDRTLVKTLGPGDFIMYPTTQGGTSLDSINNEDTDQPNQGLTTAIERAYGIDIRLVSDAENRTDIYVSTAGDLGTIVGIPNVKQGVSLKFSTERGELPAHPAYGALLRIGSKLNELSFNEFRLNATSTIMSDPRVKSIKKMSFTSQGDILGVQADLVLTNTADGNATAFSSGTF